MSLSRKRHLKPSIGVCAMDAKVRSKPMRSILSRLARHFDIILFGDNIILDEPVDMWPFCDFLIAFHSRGFPLLKAIDYVNSRQPICVNDVPLQCLLMDRRLVLAVLDAIDVPTPKRLWTTKDGGPQRSLSPDLLEIVGRDFGVDFTGGHFSPNQQSELINEALTVNGQGNVLYTPFVEKPADAENHNINVILDPNHMRLLFRKVGNRSSKLIKTAPKLRHDADYIYEEFLLSENAEDIKVYTVGPYYVYAESRKAPTKDGVVERNAEGKELRSPIQLTKAEQEMARRVCIAFGQTVCGFDLLRCNGNSYVIDVNGWSFVKGNEEYYDQCAQILHDIFYRISRKSISYGLPVSRSLHERSEWMLESCVSIFRHADRTPKQKYKTVLNDSDNKLLDEFRKIREIHGSVALLDFMNDIKKMDDELFRILQKRSKTPGTKVQLHKKNELGLSVSVKWGGEFTHAGRHQAHNVGESVRQELSLLLNTCGEAYFLNTGNITIHASKERRVVATANVFAKALLGLSEIPNDLVKIDNPTPDEADIVSAKQIIDLAKTRMLAGRENSIKELYELLQCVSDYILSNNQINTQTNWCCSDSPLLFKERWKRLSTEVLSKPCSKLDPARIFDLYDSLKYDVIHHREYLRAVAGPKLTELVDSVQKMFNDLATRQYGVDREEQIVVAKLLSGKLMECVLKDLDKHMQFSFYFTKESNLHCLHTLLKYSLNLPEIGELDYLAQIELQVWRRVGENGSQRSLCVGIRNGAHLDRLADETTSERSSDHTLELSRKRTRMEFVDFEYTMDCVRKLGFK